MDFGIVAKFTEFENLCNAEHISKKDYKILKSKYKDLLYYIKVETKRGNISNPDELHQKYLDMLNKAKDCLQS